MDLNKSTYYGDYLKLDKFLDCQHPYSKKEGDESHDEMLFIIVHQAYELWFKQIIHEIDSILELFQKDSVPEESLLTVVSRLNRIKTIQTVLINQFDVLETMTPMDFLEFRDLLIPASGFQSAQFREIEIKMGLRTNERKEIDRKFFVGRLSESDKEKVLNIEKEKSLLEVMEKWLERVPFVRTDNYNFWDEYKDTVYNNLKKDEEIVNSNIAHLTEKQTEIQLENLKSTKDSFESLFNKEEHNKLISEGKRRLSQRATLSALFILLYRDEPILQQPFNILTSLMDIDEAFTSWRYRHALLAQRMLGTKIGTGGSSGHRYLKSAAENNRIYLDLFNLSTFLISRSKLPTLPKEIKDSLNFHFTVTKS